MIEMNKDNKHSMKFSSDHYLYFVSLKDTRHALINQKLEIIIKNKHTKAEQMIILSYHDCLNLFGKNQLELMNQIKGVEK